MFVQFAIFVTILQLISAQYGSKCCSSKSNFAPDYEAMLRTLDLMEAKMENGFSKNELLHTKLKTELNTKFDNLKATCCSKNSASTESTPTETVRAASSSTETTPVETLTTETTTTKATTTEPTTTEATTTEATTTKTTTTETTTTEFTTTEPTTTEATTTETTTTEPTTTEATTTETTTTKTTTTETTTTEPTTTEATTTETTTTETTTTEATTTETTTTETTTTEAATTSLRYCAEALEKSGKDGVYKITIPNSTTCKPFDAYCMNSNAYGEKGKYTNGPWMIIQRRMDGSQDFYKYWRNYKDGFGDLNREFHMGLDKLHALTQSTPHELWIQMEDYHLNEHWAYYSGFSIDSEAKWYGLKLGYPYQGSINDQLWGWDTRKFSTRDNDHSDSKFDCMNTYKTAWWLENCAATNLNGEYGTNMDGNRGIWWKDYNGKSKKNVYLKKVHMAIRPIQNQLF